jgi:capsular exopolysaccharide synthesis family protein
LGKYSKALEQAKDNDARQNEPAVRQVDEVTVLDQPEEITISSQQLRPEETPGPVAEQAGINEEENVWDETPMKSQQPRPEETPGPVAEQAGISEEKDLWDEKLREIISGGSKQVAESIRMMRTKIFYPESGKPPRSILVTSAIPGEGKSFVCANLGVSIAQGIDKQALLVECDLRRPSLSKLLGLSNSMGLVDYLQSGTPLEQLIQQTSMPKLSVLPSGKPPKNPAELLDTKKMASLIDELESHHPDRLIIFDSPPIQAASETDILAKKVDKVILVIRWGYARREHAKQLVEMLGKDKILGVVFNAFEMSRLESKLQGYYYGYKDYYSSSYSKYYVQQQKPKKKRWGKRKSS